MMCSIRFINTRSLAILCTVLSAFGAQQLAAQAPIMKAPPAEVVNEARQIVAAMKDNRRGPYEAISWFCNDGAILPPKAYACSSRGGGKQHAVFSSQRKRLAELGWRVGTIFAAFDEAGNAQALAARPYWRIRELPLEQYLIDIDDGWVLRKANSYRGRVQIEDEQKAGAELLLGMLADQQWEQQHFLLLRELVRVIPHSQETDDPTRGVRRQSQLLAELDASFEPLRAEIHGQPRRSTADKVRKWLADRPAASDKIHAIASGLADDLTALYSLKGGAERLSALATGLGEQDQRIAQLIHSAAQSANSVERITHLVAAVDSLRKSMRNSTDRRKNLRRLNMMTELEAELLAVARTAPEPQTRQQALERIELLLQATHNFGWLSVGEYRALSEPIAAALKSDDGLTQDHYRRLIRRLQLAPAWAQASVKHAFAEALVYYQALDPRAAQFVDDLLRGSSLMPLANLTHLLVLDSSKLTGATSSLFGITQDSVWGLNPGLATGRLKVFSAGEELSGHQFNADDIVVIPNTTSSLFPAAGIVTVGEGNPLSHIQMLARNLGIPNVVIAESLLSELTAHDRKIVQLAASADGRVVLQEVTDEQTASTAELATAAAESPNATEKVLAPVPDLSATQPLQLAQLHAGLSGRVVGPKAANVGELARLFPDRIAPAVALPFGVFARHTEAGNKAPRLRVKRAFSRLNHGDISEQEFQIELDVARDEVGKIQLQSAFRESLVDAMNAQFGAGEHYGVFVRSDTNMEDLPQFTGAGLNETVPHVIGLNNQLAAISRVWSSVYSRRAMAWRSRILSNPDEVYSSVLLMKSVPSDKSGVLVTTDLSSDAGDAYTVSLSWGVGGAVDNESAASYLLKADGNNVLLSEAKAPYQRYLREEGGVGWKAANKGGVLEVTEMRELRALAQEVISKYPPSLASDGRALPWDIEFAFAKGKLMLLQIRPLVQRGAVAAEQAVSAIIARPVGDSRVNLTDNLLR